MPKVHRKEVIAVGKSIYKYYRERLIEIGGNNKCLYTKNVVRRGAYDIGRIFEGLDGKMSELVEFLWGTSKLRSLTLLSKDDKASLAENLALNKQIERRAAQKPQDGEFAPILSAKATSAELSKLLESEVTKIKELRRDVEEIHRETGRYELYIGYPFVFGCIPQGSTKTLIKAPLLLFPINIAIVDDHTVEITLNREEKIHINHALIFAYAQSKKLSIDSLELEFDNISEHFASVNEVVEYLNRAGIKITGTLPKNVLSYSKFKEPEPKPELSLRSAAIMGRFPLSNSIYNDYTVLEKKNLTNDALDELLRTGKTQPKKPARKAKKQSAGSYNVKMLDFAQSEVVRRVEESGNMVIYGPPGTGKSQTIVNVITDAMAKNKRVLVVSQKKAALDVVYNRLGVLSESAMYINDESKEKRAFYEKCHAAHEREMGSSLSDTSVLDAEYNEIQAKINAEVAKLDQIRDTLTKPRMPFGLSLSEMYASSYNLAKNSTEYSIYLEMIRSSAILGMTYKEFNEAMFGIREMKLGEMYYEFMQSKEKNPLIDNTRPDIDIRTLAEVKGELEYIQRTRKGLFNIAKYPYYRQVLAFYNKLGDEKNLDAIVRLVRKMGKHTLFGAKRETDEIRAKLVETLRAIREYVSEYDCLHKVLTPDGYLAVIDNVLRGNTSYIKLVYEALDSYVTSRDLNKLISTLDANKLAILNFAYTKCKSYQNYLDIISKLTVVRIYHEVLGCEERFRDELASLVDFDNITSRVYKLKEAQLDVSARICATRGSKDYARHYNESKDNKDYLYQIAKAKRQKYWPIRRMLEVYGEYVLALFPCWLLSPENVSSLLPLTKNLFDIVIFDEASQVFIENTIPTIYRGKTVVVAGDDKQLRPSATFMKRYLGADPELQEDYSVQAALEVDSLLDLAVARYESANLTYHYRSRSQELIDFSNAAFYSSSLQISPNISKSLANPPIVRHKVNGKWINRRNTEEAKKVVEVLRDIFATRKNNESIGIITFNTEQQSAIADAIDKESAKNREFHSNMLIETHRVEDGEDTGIFIKNLENVQGDERDIIIFSIGYAENELGKVYTSFGSLSADGGENRLNVAITRARSKIIVVTSIEPEELKVESSKHLGPKLLQKYLQYARAVSDGKQDEIRAILSELSPAETKAASMTVPVLDIEEDMRSRLEKLGYKVDTGLGNKNNRISLAVYDPATDRYLVGVELDRDAFLSSTSSLERDVFKPRFLEARGWRIMRVWLRDWWLSPGKVIRAIANAAERAKKK